MTKKEIKKNLKKDYIEALAFFANALSNVDEDELEFEIEELDTKVWETVGHDTEMQDTWLKIYSGLLTAV